MVHAAADTVPYYMDFDSEGTVAGVAGVTSSSASGATIQQSTYLDGLGDDDAVQLNQGGFTLTLSDTDENPTNVFVQAYIKAVECTVVPANAVDTEAGAVCVVDGTLRAYSGTAWADTGYSVPANQWIGIAAHIDYAASNWNLYVTSDNDGSFKKNMVKAGGPYSFNANSADSGKLTTVTVTNEAAQNAFVDAIAVNRSRDACVAGDTNLMIFVRKAGVTRATTIPPKSYSTSKIMADGSTQTDLGYDMALGLASTDNVGVTNGTPGGYDWFSDAGGYWSPDDAGNLYLEIEQGEGILLDRLSATEDVLAFYPYAIADIPADPIAVPLVGTDDENYKGQSDTALPSTYKGGCVDINSGVFNMASGRGDMILFYRDDLYPPSRQFYWNGSKWVLDGAEVDYEVCPGDEFMYYNRSGGTLTWTVSQP
jgi:hypothetical protein